MCGPHIEIRQRQVVSDDYFHWLHHRYFECNYGGTSGKLVPLDRWLKTFHDGTAEGLAQMKKRRRMPREAKGLV
tara:strand:+ start:222 stop:443 length:222 start_codon:yes stop_codon:yes gene_type:complete